MTTSAPTPPDAEVAQRQPDQPAARRGARKERLWWAGSGAVATAALMFCYLRIAGTTAASSDGAGDALQGWDMLHGNVLLHGWWATDVSFWTTELLQYALVVAVAGLRPEVVHICAAITYTLLVLLAAAVAKGRSTGLEAVARVLVASVVMLAPEPGAGAYLLLGWPDHVGAGVPALVVFLLLDRAPRRWWVPVATGLLLAWGIVGDPLVLLVAAFPVIVVYLTRASLLLRRQAPGRLALYELSLAAAAIAGVIVAQLTTFLVQASGGLALNKVAGAGSGLYWNPVLTARSVLVLFGADPGTLASLWSGDPGGLPGHTQNGLEIAFAFAHLLGPAAVAISIGLVGWNLVRARRQRTDLSPDVIPQLLVAGILTNIAVYLAVYTVGSVMVGHEVAPVLSLGAALAGRLLGDPLARAARSSGWPARRLFRPALAAILVAYCAMLGYASARPQVPPANMALTKWLADRHLASGLAGYWDASSVTLDSSKRVTIQALIVSGRGRLAPYRWEADMRQFNPAVHSANFLVLAPNWVGGSATESMATATFGQPAAKYHYGPYIIMVWHKNLLRDLGPAIVPGG
jgi:hypothetical protein